MKYDPNVSPDACSTALGALDFTDDIVYRLDRGGNQTYLNPAGHRLLALEPGASLGKRFDVFVHEDDLPGYREAAAQALRRGTDARDIHARLVSTTGDIVLAAHRMRPLRDTEGAVIGLLGIARDVSALRRLEDQLLQSQKLETIGLLAGGIAHDFNNMLAAILGFTELMLEDRDEADPDYRGLHYIQTSTERAAALVRQILVFTRKSSVDLKPVRFAAILEETLLMLRRTLPKTIRVAVDDEAGDAYIRADAGRVQQALMNLCLNARDAMPNGGELRIRIERTIVEDAAPVPTGAQPGEYVRLRIQDTGHGIPPHVLEQIWTPFFTTKPAGVGTGLGLAVVQQIVQAHHGFITVESAAGQGATFFVYLPASTESQLEMARQRAEPEGGGETILVVDDEPVLLELLRDILQPKGYHVLAAESPIQALEYIDAVGDRIDLVVSDNMMPTMTGRELAREIRARYPSMRILVCSGFSPTREDEIGEMDYVSSYVQKPYQRRDLLARVRAALDSPPSESGETTGD